MVPRNDKVDEERSLVPPLLLRLLLLLVMEWLAAREGEGGGDCVCDVCLWLVGSQEGSHMATGDGCCSRAVMVTGANTAAAGRGRGEEGGGGREST